MLLYFAFKQEKEQKYLLLYLALILNQRKDAKNQFR